MIFYFSGTGNSFYAAKKLAEATGENLISISQALKERQFSYELADHEKIGFVMPIYAWDMPHFIVDFIRKLEMKGYRDQYVFGLFTGGGKTGAGYAGERLEKTLQAKRIILSAGFYVLMPGNYTVGYGAMPKEMETKVLDSAEKELIKITDWIKEEKEMMEYGGYPIPNFVYQGISYLFNKKAMDTEKFYVKENCISCGKCETNCPIGVIQMENGKPKWTKSRCTKCLACVNLCPVEAIEYGNSTQGKRRYQNPRI